MTNRRLTRVNELLKREIAGELYRLFSTEAFDLAAVTVTRVNVSSNLRHAKVFISVRGSEHDKARMLHELERRRKPLQQRLNEHTKLKYTPHLDFIRDDSIQQGDRVLSIIQELEHTQEIDDATE